MREPLRDCPPPTIRLGFRPWSTSDVARLAAICDHPDVMRFIGDGQRWEASTTAAFIDQEMANFRRLGYCRWALVLLSTDELIGFCGFVPHAAGLEIGWRLALPTWGRGLATEAGRAAIAFGFSQLGVAEIRATVHADNLASQHVAQKLGMTPLAQPPAQTRISFALDRTRWSSADP